MRDFHIMFNPSSLTLFPATFLESASYSQGFPGGLDGKESACHAEDLGSIPGSGSLLEKEIATHSSILDWETP